MKMKQFFISLNIKTRDKDFFLLIIISIIYACFRLVSYLDLFNYYYRKICKIL